MKPVRFFAASMALAIGMTVFAANVSGSETDSRIESAAKNSYVFKTYLKKDAVHVESKDGAVTLKGSVSDPDHKQLAQETVSGLPDVKSVDNQLKVKEPMSDKTSDAWIETKIKTALLFHRDVSAKTKVDVKNGVATLRGQADNAAQKDLTTEYAKDIDGVKEVKNEMTVAGEKTAAAEKAKGAGETAKEKIDDASITAMVKMTLLTHKSTSALNTSVTTKDGVVTLTGKAANPAEKDLAGKLASNVKGVSSVVNNMTVNGSAANY